MQLAAEDYQFRDTYFVIGSPLLVSLILLLIFLVLFGVMYLIRKKRKTKSR